MTLRRLRDFHHLATHTNFSIDSFASTAIAASTLFPGVARQTDRYLGLKITEAMSNPFSLPEGGQLGEFTVGYYQSRGEMRPMTVTRQSLNQHLFVGGATRSGKTNWLNFLGLQLLGSNVPVIWIDLKQEARHLIKLWPDLWVFPIESFRWNPLEVPEGVNPKWWLNAFASVYAHAFGILHASEGAILQYVDDLYRKYGVYEGSGKFPSLFDLRDYLEQYKIRAWSEEARYLQRTKNRVETMCRVLGETVAVSKGFNFSELLERSWVLEIGSLKPDVQSFVAETLMTTIFIYRISSGQRNQGLKNVVIFDDGKKVWDRNKELRPPEGIPTITSIISLVREFGVGVVVVDQDPWMVSQSLLDNAGIKLCLAPGSGRTVSEMASAMGLSREQGDFLHKLQVGQGCMKLSGQDPCLVVIPEFPITKDVTDADIHSSMKPVMETLKIAGRLQMELPEDDKYGRQLTRMLEHVAEQPLLSVTERFEALGLSAWAGERVVKELLVAGLVIPVIINRGGRGGRAKYLELTAKAREMLEADGFKVRRKGRGGVKHLYWQRRICEAFRRKGYYAEVEVSLGDVYIDVFASDDDGRRVGVQVVIGEVDRYEFVGIRKAVEAGLDHVIVACESDTVGRAVEARLPDELGEHGVDTVSVMVMPELAKSLEGNSLDRPES